MKIKNYEIKKKLLVGFGIPLGLFLVTIMVFIGGVFYIQNQFSDFYNYTYELSKNTQSSCTAVQGAAKSVAFSMVLTDEKMIQSFQDNAAGYMDTLEANLEELVDVYRDDTTKIKETLNIIKEAKGYREEIEAAVLAQKPAEALTLYMTKYGPKMTAIQTNIQELNQIVEELASTTFLSGRSGSTWILLLALIISVISLVATVTMAKRLIVNLTQPIKEIEHAAKEMTEGNLSVTVDYESEDELGSLAHSMKTLGDDVNEIIHDIAYIFSWEVLGIHCHFHQQRDTGHQNFSVHSS